MINLKLKPDLVQSLDRLNFYSFSLLSNENFNNDDKLSLFSKANTFVTALFNNSNINFTEKSQGVSDFYEVNNFQQLNNLISKEFKKVTLD